MGDALCGPSNALQNLQKHSSADRALQQDRFKTRHGPSQGFRSYSGDPVAALDPEFEAFQAEFSNGPPQSFAQPFPRLSASKMNQSIQSETSPSNWAADFQRLQISSPSPQTQFLFNRPAPQLSPVIDSSLWHQDFLQSSSSAPSNQSSGYQSQRLNIGLPGHLPVYGTQERGTGGYLEQPKGKERATGTVFDDAAFERAFQEAQATFVDSMTATTNLAQENESKIADGRIPEETVPLMRMMWEKQPATYLVVKTWNAFGFSTDSLPFTQDSAENASAFLGELERLQQRGGLSESEEVLRVKKALGRIIAHDQLPQNSEYQFASRARILLERIEGRATTSDERQLLPGSGGESHLPERVMERSIFKDAVKENEEAKKIGDDEELARTAGHLLDSVSDNTSKKFQESNFLALMRKLRDHEVKVDGDQMIETSSLEIFPNEIPLREQDTDSGRLGPIEDTSRKVDDHDVPAPRGRDDVSAYRREPSYAWIRYALETVESGLAATANEERAWTDFGRIW